jgi:CubicO group peptidase (beta-lactamase class C family)
MITRSAAALLLALLYCTPCGADDRFAGMDAYIREAMQRWEVPGLAIAVVKDGEVVVARGYGVCELGGERLVTKDSVFSIASCTKSFTAAALALLVDEGKVKWDDPVRTHLPQFQVADAYVSEHATLRDLACHRTGLVHGDLLATKGEFGRDDILQRMRFLGQTAPFRTKFTYHNVMYFVLGEVIAARSGLSWEEFVARRLLRPLKMTSSTVSRLDVPTERLAPRHYWRDGAVHRHEKTRRNDGAAPAGAIYSNVVDMARWLTWHVQEGTQEKERLLKPATLRELHALHLSIPVSRQPDSNIYQANMVGTGLGWFVRDYRGKKVVQHGGAWGADMAFVPADNLAVVALSNLDHNLLVQMLSFDVIDAYLVGPEYAWSNKDNWDFWLKVGGPANYDRGLREHKAELERGRTPDTKPSLALEKYAGRYDSDLYGGLEVHHEQGRLFVQFGDHAGGLSHWQDDTFYSPAVVVTYLDWLVKFHIEGESVDRLEVVSIGWKDPDEQHVFRRVPHKP